MSLSSASILARWLSCNVMNLIDSGRPKIAASANTTGAMPPKRRECEGAGGHTAAELGSRASDQFQSPKYRRSVDRIAVFGRCRRRRSVSRGVPAHTTDLRWPPPLRSQAQIEADGQGDSGKGVRGTRGCVFRKLEPIAGHRANMPLVKYLSEGREMEIALAPIAGTRLLAPFRLSVVSTLANLM